jgi:initiation factor 1A
MVKNTTGGTGTKGLARKHMNKGRSEHVRIPECNDEKFGYVSKMFGHGMCEINIDQNTKLTGHIRNKFRGRQKRHNLITQGSIVLIGMRDWETVAKNCDILSIYDDNDIKQLKNRADINIDEVIKIQQNNCVQSHMEHTDNLEFCTNQMEEDEEDLAELEKVNKHTNTFQIKLTDEIEMDDI